MTRTGDGANHARRAVLAGTGALAVSALAGCLGGGRASDRGSERGSESGGPTATPDENSLSNHPAAANLDAQPTRGPDPFEARGVVVAFEDPSCPRCRVFEQDTVPQIQSDLVESGTVSLVFRGYPVIYPWGKPATQALESTFAASADAFWALKNHYFAKQSSFTTDNVLDATREFLAANADVDAEAVVADAEAKGHDAQVQADLDAGMAAGAGHTTPSVFLFSNGEYRTKASGSVSYSVVKNALGL